MAGARVDASLMEAIEIAEKLGDDAIQGITRPIGVINGSPVTEKRVVNSQEVLTKGVILHLREIFISNLGAESSADQNRALLATNSCLNRQDFHHLLTKYSIPSPIISTIYNKLDVNNAGSFNFIQFIDFLIASESSVLYTEMAYTGKLVKLYEQTNIYDFHKTSIDNLLYITKPFPLLITAARDDNMLHLWDLSHGHQRCRKVASIKHVDKSKVFIDNLVKSMGKAQRSNYYCSKSSSTATNSAVVAAITAVCDIPHTPHICVCSADCAVTLYEMFTNEPCGKITDLKEVPTCIVAFPQIIEDSAVSGGNDQDAQVTNKSTVWIAFGDAVGYIRILKLDPEFSPPNDTGGKSRYTKYFEQALTSASSYSQRKAHSDWIHRIMYISEINCLVTSSSDGTVCLIDFDVKGHSGVYFEGHLTAGKSQHGKCHVNLLAWSAYNKYVVSVASRKVLMWDPYTFDVLCTLDGFTSNVVDICVSDSNSKLFVTLSDKSVRVYHYNNFDLLQTIYETATFSPDDVLSRTLFIEPKELILTGNKIAIWNIIPSSDKIKPVDSTANNGYEDIVTVLFNPLYSLIITVTTLGKVSVYNAVTGVIENQFTISHIKSAYDGNVSLNNIIPPNGYSVAHPSIEKDSYSGIPKRIIKLAVLDQSCKRILVVTMTGLLQVWNFITCECLSSVKPVIHVDRHVHTSSSDCDISLLHHNTADYVLAVTHDSNMCMLRARESAFDITPSQYYKRFLSKDDEVVDEGFRAVELLWVKATPGYHVKSTAVTGYSDGAVILWSLEHAHKLKEWSVTRETGVILSGIIKTKVDNSKQSMSKRRGLLPVMSRTNAAGASHVKHLLSQYNEQGLLNKDSATGTGSELEETPKISESRAEPSSDVSRLTIVSCAVYSAPCVVFGACSDNYIRFWDGESGSLLCSFDALAANKDDERRGEDDHIQLLRLSDVENILIGGYRSGKVCVWTIYSDALLALKGLVTAGNATLNVQDALVASPLHFVNEWIAHSSALQALEFVYFSNDDENKEELRGAEAASSSSKRALNEKYTNALRDDFNPDGFILTSSLDQATYLWRTDGQFVGECGGMEWDIFDDASYSNAAVIDEYSHQPKPPTSTRGSKTSRARPVTLSYTDQIHNNAQMNLYVESLKAKNAAKPPPSHEGNVLYKAVTSAHPILDLAKLQLKKYMKGEASLDIPMFKSNKKKNK